MQSSSGTTSLLRAEMCPCDVGTPLACVRHQLKDRSGKAARNALCQNTHLFGATLSGSTHIFILVIIYVSTSSYVSILTAYNVYNHVLCVCTASFATSYMPNDADKFTDILPGTRAKPPPPFTARRTQISCGITQKGRHTQNRSTSITSYLLGVFEAEVKGRREAGDGGGQVPSRFLRRQVGLRRRQVLEHR